MTRIIKAECMNETASPRAVLLNLRDFAEEARAVVLDARKQAAKVLGDARAKADGVKRQSADQGYSEGFARGQNDGYADGRKQAQDEGRQKVAADFSGLLELGRRIVQELSAARAELMDQAARQMLEFAIELAEKIVGRVAATDIQAAKTNLAKAMALVGRNAEVVVKVNPRQLEQLREHCAELAEALHLRGVVRLAGDERISPGGVKILSGGQIDATIETQLANVVEALVGQGEPPDGKPASPPEDDKQLLTGRWESDVTGPGPAAEDEPPEDTDGPPASEDEEPK